MASDRERAEALAEEIGCEDLPSIVDALTVALSTARQEERERCAKVADAEAADARANLEQDLTVWARAQVSSWKSTATAIAAAIRRLDAHS
jgi:hypothetical protein